MFWTPEKVASMWRFPDKPVEALPAKLRVFDGRGGYVAQQKLDGYRLVVMLEEGRATCISRHQKVLPVNQAILDSMLAIDGLALPAMLDTEWMKLRGGLQEGVVILDSLYLGGEWMGNLDLYRRRESYYNKPLPPGISVPQEVTTGFVDFLAAQMAPEGVDPATTIAEGVVIKKIDAKLLGSRTKSDENPSWAKIKWRHGQGGDTVVVSREALAAIR